MNDENKGPPRDSYFDPIYADETESAWERGQQAIERKRACTAHMPLFPDTLEKLLAMKEWRGSKITRKGNPCEDSMATLVLTHPCGAQMRIKADYFQIRALDKAKAKKEKDEIEARRAAKRARKASFTRHTVGT